MACFLRFSYSSLFTFMVKPDFISLFLFIVLLIFINTGKTNYLFMYFDKILIGILVVIGYDLFDYFFLRKIAIDSMSAVDGWSNLFCFLFPFLCSSILFFLFFNIFGEFSLLFGVIFLLFSGE